MYRRECREAQQGQSLRQALRTMLLLPGARETLINMFLRDHVVGKQVAQRSTCSEGSLCSDVQVADCVVFCIASAALSGLLTCGALRFPRRKGRCRNFGQGTAPQSSVATSVVPQSVTPANCKAAAEPHSPVKYPHCQKKECLAVPELHRAVSNQKVHTEEALQDALQDALREKEVLLQQTHAQEKLVTQCQGQLADKSAQLREQHLQQSWSSEQSAAIIASLQSKVQEQTDLIAQLRADLGQEKHRMQHFRDRLQAVEWEWNASKTALTDARLRTSSLLSAKQQSDTQHDSQVQEMSDNLKAAQHLRQAAEKELLNLKQKAAEVAGKLELTGPAIIRMKEKSAQNEQEKVQLELTVSAQAKHSRAVEAELASATARTRQLEMDLQVVKECLVRNRRRTPLAENVAHTGRQQTR